MKKPKTVLKTDMVRSMVFCIIIFGLAVIEAKGLVCTGSDAGVGTFVVPILGEGALFGVFSSVSVEKKSLSWEICWWRWRWWGARLRCRKFWLEFPRVVLEIDRQAAGRLAVAAAVEIPPDVGREQSDRALLGNKEEVLPPVTNDASSDSIE
jgi:hypothetical protein